MNKKHKGSNGSRSRPPKERMQTFSISVRPSQRQRMADVAREMGIDSESQVYRVAIQEFLERRAQMTAA